MPVYKMTPAAANIADKRQELRDLHEQYDSWRDVKRLHYPGVNHETLRRIALTKYLPKDRKILQALGLIPKPREWLPGERRVRRKIAKMAKETKESVLR